MCTYTYIHILDLIINNSLKQLLWPISINTFFPCSRENRGSCLSSKDIVKGRRVLNILLMFSRKLVSSCYLLLGWSTKTYLIILPIMIHSSYITNLHKYWKFFVLIMLKRHFAFYIMQKRLGKNQFSFLQILVGKCFVNKWITSEKQNPKLDLLIHISWKNSNVWDLGEKRQEVNKSGKIICIMHISILKGLRSVIKLV